MRKKVLLTIIGIGVLSIMIFSSINVFATNIINGELRKQRGLEIVSINDTFKKIKQDDIKTLKVNTQEKILEIANYYLNNFEGKSINKEEMKFEFYNSGLMSRNEIILDTTDYSFTINADTGNLINYSKHMKEFPKCNLTREEIKDIANNLFAKANLCNIEDYEMIYLEEYDEGIWWVAYAKKYDDLINKGEIVKFHFVPINKEIWVLGSNNVTYENNEINITEEQARNIANKYLEKSTANDMKIYLDIVNPNDFLLEEKLNENEMYSFAQFMRKAYVCEFNNDANTKLYIDCTSGEILGGTTILGGEF